MANDANVVTDAQANAADTTAKPASLEAPILWKTFLDKTPAVLTLASIILLSLTIVHEWGYFESVGAPLQSIMSANDYLTNAILWLPFTVTFVVLIGGAVEVSQRFFDRPAQIETAKPETLFATIVTAAPFTALTFLIDIWMGIAAAICAACVIVITRYEQQGGISRTLSRWVRITLTVFFVAFSWGVFEGQRDLQESRFKVQVQWKESAASSEFVLLRTLEKGLLVRDDKRTRFIRMDVIKEFSMANRRPPVSLMCRWFDLCAYPQSRSS